jgi:hypothetical protein
VASWGPRRSRLTLRPAPTAGEATIRMERHGEWQPGMLLL